MGTADPPPPEAQRLSRFVGEWAVEGAMASAGDISHIRGCWTDDPVADGWGVRGVLKTEIDGFGEVDEAELIGYDPATASVHLFSMNRFAIRDHVGGWTADHTLTLRFQGVEDGAEVVEDFSIEFVGPDRIQAQVVERRDGQVTITTDLTMGRQA